ncbi:transcriptional regulator [Rhizobium sp.]|uniref:transcriptional regulator n=1 Tax=Rhizobium sp. TaxID=391 RepID=UPI0028AC9E28
MLVFLDFEASSLSKHSYPIEIAWVFEDGTAKSYLIKPKPGWTDWSEKAEMIHGLSREQLEREGVDISTIVEEMMATLVNADLLASAPSWDGKWLSTLLRAGGQPRHVLRLRKTDEALKEVAKSICADISEQDLGVLVDQVIRETAPAAPAHRALPDAILERERWLAVRQRARSWKSGAESSGT